MSCSCATSPPSVGLGKTHSLRPPVTLLCHRTDDGRHELGLLVSRVMKEFRALIAPMTYYYVFGFVSPFQSGHIHLMDSDHKEVWSCVRKKKERRARGG